MKTFVKHDDNTLKETETVEVEHTYDLTFLKNQKVQLEAELARVEVLLAECDKLGIEEALPEVII